MNKQLRCLLRRAVPQRMRKTREFSKENGHRSFVCRRRCTLSFSHLSPFFLVDGLLCLFDKKVMDLEARIEQLSEELKAAASGKPRSKGDAAAVLPRAPAKHQLQGHRGKQLRLQQASSAFFFFENARRKNHSIYLRLQSLLLRSGFIPSSTCWPPPPKTPPSRFSLFFFQLGGWV